MQHRGETPNERERLAAWPGGVRMYHVGLYCGDHFELGGMSMKPRWRGALAPPSLLPLEPGKDQPEGANVERQQKPDQDQPRKKLLPFPSFPLL